MMKCITMLCEDVRHKKREGEKGMVLRKKKIILDGEEVEVELFDTKIVPGSGKELDSVEKLLKEEEIEKAVQEALKQIEKIAKEYVGKEKDIWYYYEVGKALQFVDKKGFTDVRGLIWERMADNLHPELFGGKKKDRIESKRYPEFMYHLGKQSRKNIGRIKLYQWYEILKFSGIYEDKKVFECILKECENNPGLSQSRLRSTIRKIRKSK